MSAEFWSRVLTAEPADAPATVQQICADAESRRGRASYDTGSIDAREARLLLSLVTLLHVRVAIEVGTFIGTSTMALAAAPAVEAVYTCDVSNDCGPSGGAIRPYPKQTSTQMLRDLVARGVTADLGFFDGALTADDAKLLRRVTHAGTVYAVHDYAFGPKIRAKHGVVTHEIVPRKGIGNINLLWPALFQTHALVEPLPGVLIAALVPRARL